MVRLEPLFVMVVVALRITVPPLADVQHLIGFVCQATIVAPAVVAVERMLFAVVVLELHHLSHHTLPLW